MPNGYKRGNQARLFSKKHKTPKIRNFRGLVFFGIIGKRNLMTKRKPDKSNQFNEEHI